MIEGYMFEEHEMLRRAATECMCNLAMNKEVRPTRELVTGSSAQGAVLSFGFRSS